MKEANLKNVMESVKEAERMIIAYKETHNDRETSLALTKIQEAEMWLNRSG